MKRCFGYLLILAMFTILLPLKAEAATLPISIDYNDIIIPSSTTLLSSGIVSGGKVTYNVTVVATVTSNVDFSGSQLTIGDPGTSTVKRIGSGVYTLSPTYSSGQYIDQKYCAYEVRGTISSFNVAASVAGGGHSGYTTANVSFPVASNYYPTFRTTYYIIARESDYTGSYTATASGISGKLFKPNFLADVRVQGSGYSHYNEYMQYNAGSGTFSIVSYPTTAMGTTPTVNKTIAVDPYYIPRISGQLAKVYINGVGDRQAEDGGGAITGFRIDVFYGTGKPSSDPSWSGTYRPVYYYGNNLW